MAQSKTVLITGASGGIGSALVNAYGDAGWTVIATDRVAASGSGANHFVEADLSKVARDDGARDALCTTVREIVGDGGLGALVNNAAVQRLASVDNMTRTDWDETMNINLAAPWRLTQALLSNLRKGEGAVVNIGSVHAQATKREFIAYATSKAAIHGLTRAMAVDLGASPRVVCVAPAAVGTSMLEDGFEGRPNARVALADAHPAGRIATPSEVAKAVVAVSQPPFLFATGSIFWLDGGVLSRLHDPA